LDEDGVADVCVVGSDWFGWSCEFLFEFRGEFSFKVLGHFATPVGAGVTYTYDANGNRQSAVDAVANTTATYGWDDMSRLVSVCTAATGTACTLPEEVNVYDADGQRLVRRSSVGGSGSSGLQPGFIPSTTGESPVCQRWVRPLGSEYSAHGA
jgi:YD repeat-containing protein